MVMENNNMMNNKERILALDAALTVCEGVTAPEGVINAIHLLQQMLDKYEAELFDQPNFGLFLKEQKESCRKLANQESLWGF